MVDCMIIITLIFLSSIKSWSIGRSPSMVGGYIIYMRIREVGDRQRTRNMATSNLAMRMLKDSRKRRGVPAIASCACLWDSGPLWSTSSDDSYYLLAIRNRCITIASIEFLALNPPTCSNYIYMDSPIGFSFLKPSPNCPRHDNYDTSDR